MSGLATPRKNFRFMLELDGSNAFLIQEIQAPTVELAVIEHGAPANDPNSKTPGKLKIGELVIKRLKPALFADTWVEDWMAQAMAGTIQSFYKTGFLKHLGPDGVSVVQNYFLGDVWPSKNEPGNLVLMAPGENLIDTITLQVKYYHSVESTQMNALLAAGLASGIAGALGSDLR
jgi:hypothetical protein